MRLKSLILTVLLTIISAPCADCQIQGLLRGLAKGLKSSTTKRALTVGAANTLREQCLHSSELDRYAYEAMLASSPTQVISGRTILISKNFQNVDIESRGEKINLIIPRKDHVFIASLVMDGKVISSEVLKGQLDLPSSTALIDWVSITQNGNTISITATPNTSASRRSINVTVSNGDKYLRTLTVTQMPKLLNYTGFSGQ